MKYIFDKLLYTEKGQIITSCIIGFGVAFLFKRVCVDDCTIYRAPYINEINDATFKLEETCYKYLPVMVDCNDEKKVLLPYNMDEQPMNKVAIKSNINEN